MTTQLRLLPAELSWRLDEETKRIGRHGLAQARAALNRHPADVDAAAPAIAA